MTMVDPYNFGTAPQRWAITKPLFQQPTLTDDAPLPPTVVSAWQQEQAAKAKASVPVRPPKLHGSLEQRAVRNAAARALKARDQEEQRFQKLRALAELAGDVLPQRPPAPEATSRAVGYVASSNRRNASMPEQKYLTDS